MTDFRNADLSITATPELDDDTGDIHFVPAPCQVACPIGTDAPSYIGYIWEGQYEKALPLAEEAVVGARRHLSENHHYRTERLNDLGIIIDLAFDHEYTRDQIHKIATTFCEVFNAAKAPKKPVPFVIVLLSRL